jgi:hypothetical protein
MPIVAYAALRALLLVHGLVTLAAAVVLVVAPAFIPALVGIELAPNAYLVAYLLGAAQLAIGALSLGGSRLSDAAGLRLIATTCIVLHAASAALILYATHGQPVNRIVVLNVIARCIIIVLFIALSRPRP